MGPLRDDELTAALRELRPAPSAAFAATLDERAAAGFPRPARPGTVALARLRARLSGIEPRRLLLPAAAASLVLIVTATVVVSTGQSGPGRTASPSPPPAIEAQAGAPRELKEEGFAEGAPTTPSAGGVASAAGSSSGARGSGSFESQHRDVEHSAEITLGTDPGGVDDAAGRVFEAVHAAHGIVLRSSVRDGSAGEAGAQFELLIPSGRLNDALASFSEIAEVRSRHDGTLDITAPTVGAGERLHDSEAKVEALLSELAGAETEAEREAIEAKLRSARGRSARLGAQLDALKKQASLSRVSLRIVSGDSATGSGGGWDVGDALGDAGHILAVAAGVTLVGLAVLGPIALIALLAWAANRVWVRRQRHRALG